MGEKAIVVMVTSSGSHTIAHLVRVRVRVGVRVRVRVRVRARVKVRVMVRVGVGPRDGPPRHEAVVRGLDLHLLCVLQ